MADESVIFEIQVDKKVLEQVFNENKHLRDSYEKVIKGEDVVRGLKEENARLRATIKRLEVSDDERKILEELLRDKAKLQQTEMQLKEANDKLRAVTQELEQNKKSLGQIQDENKHLDEDKLRLELDLADATRKLRLLEERNKSNDLEHVESKLLKLKLQTVENEKKYLLDEFERERKIIIKQNKPRVAKLEENLKLLRKWIEKEAKERRPRDTEEVKMLKAQIQILENDKIDLIEGFELERKVFQKILKSGGYNSP